MTRRDLLSMAAVAAGTFGLAVAVFLPRGLDAGEQTPKLAAQIERPKLVVNGCELSISRGEGLEAGAKPTFELVASNPTEQSASVEVSIGLTSAKPSSPLSRVPSRPSSLWQESRIIALAPGEQATFELASTAALPSEGEISVDLASGKQAISAMRFSVGQKKAVVAAPSR